MDVLMIAGAPGRCRHVAAAVLAAVALVGHGTLAAQAQSEVSVTAALLYNFAKFTEWPALSAGAPIAICVAADEVMAGAVAATVKGQQINGHPLTVSQPADAAAWHLCQILFIADAEARRLADALARIRTAPVLTVSDRRMFANSGGIIELYVEKGKMAFAINVDAAERAELRLSSRLLGVARIVRNVDGS
jgi:hypothetical protein